MIDHPIIYFLNTQGVIVFVFFILALEFFVIKNTESFLHTTLSVITAIFITIILKELFSVPRPSELPLAQSYAGLDYLSSFPSMHTSIAFAAATTVFLHQKQTGFFMIIIASLIGFGRVAANVHYPVDIAFGMLIGVLIGVFFDELHFKVKRKK